MIPVAEARRFVLSACRPLPIGPVHMRDALGHVLAEVLRAPEAVPRFANSAMDGYALRAVDTHPAPARLRVLGSVMAGDHSKVLVSAGDAIRIMTGAPVPPGADAVCMIERTRVEEHGAIVVVEEAVHPGTNVRRAGEDVLMGAELFGPGTRVGPAHLGVLSSLGIESVLAYRRPTVGVLSTGDELLTTAGTPGPGKIRDANRPALLAQIQTDGFQTVDLGIARDDEGLLAEILEDGASRCDAIVASGGVSVGDRDAMKAVLEKMGGSTVRSMQVAVKPAKPFAFARLDGTGTPVFGLPGNPVSALVSYE
ncbi:MAG: molybdopterin molybdotransferase MoeA, partial [Acidimicrobiales bacterium]